MLFDLKIRNKTVKELRKNQGYTIKEMAAKLNLSSSQIMKVDDLKLKDVPEPLYTKLLPFLRGDDLDKVPWL